MMRDAEQYSGITRAAMHTMAEQETNIHVIERDVDNGHAGDEQVGCLDEFFVHI